MTTQAISVTIVSDRNSTQPQTEKIDEILINRISRIMLAPLIKKRELIRTILKNNPDIVIWYGTPLSAIYLTQLRSIGKPVIWDIDTDLHSLKIFSRISFREMFHPHHNLLWQQILTAICPRFVIRGVANSALISKIIVPSQYFKESLCKIGIDPGKITVIPSTIEMDDLNRSNAREKTKELRKKMGFKPEDFIVTYFGSPCTLRGVDTVIRSIQKTLMKLKNIKLIVLSRRELGKSTAAQEHFITEEEYLKKLVRKLEVEDRVEIIPGILNKSRLKQYIYTSDVIALPFKLIFSDPPLSVLEAMSFGKVVVTTNLGSLCEIVRNDRGILIEPGRSDALAQVFLFLAEHPEESAYIGKNAQRFAESLPNWDHITLQFVKVLDEIFEEAHGEVPR
jgi:glycosyltransferase involved in cell wall biosynthesis